MRRDQVFCVVDEPVRSPSRTRSLLESLASNGGALITVAALIGEERR